MNYASVGTKFIGLVVLLSVFLSTVQLHNQLLSTTLTNTRYLDAPWQIPPQRQIPRILYFIHTEINIIQEQRPARFYTNIENTIGLYQQAWNDTPVSVRFLTDSECRTIVNETEPRLLRYYEAEKNGAFQADMCRVAALYQTGGYYFDVDMRTVEAWIVSDSCTFGTALNSDGTEFAQSILATTALHPVLQRAFEVMLGHYDDISNQEWNGTVKAIQRSHMGPRTLKQAYDLHQESIQNGSNTIEASCLLREVNLEDHKGLYPDLQRQHGDGGACNYVMHNGTKVYFFSRMVGAGQHCSVSPGQVGPISIRVRGPREARAVPS